MDDPTKPFKFPSMNMNPGPEDDEIARLAHRYYEENGKPEGKAEEHWARAKGELQQNLPKTVAEPARSAGQIQQGEEEMTQASGKMG